MPRSRHSSSDTEEKRPPKAKEDVSALAASGSVPDVSALAAPGRHRHVLRPGGKCRAKTLEEARLQKGREEWSSSFSAPGFKHTQNDDEGHFTLGTTNPGDKKDQREVRDENISMSPCTILCIQEANLAQQRALMNEASSADRSTYSGWKLQEFADDSFATKLCQHQQDLMAAGRDSALAGDGGLLTIAQA
jgi:hypothetical protein